ncbi:MAG: phospholipase, partial [candidate division Zixibacteria bacterium]|nr:phospholipase [candidate division Zixibacteria bacterium]NIW41450.1 phospholipase [candidate division Zixibacteria bacterium]NIX58082.1 phospholipase [candidate division Zixibacteria bacterium]
GDGETSVYMHSKLMIVDDRLAIMGSANLSNRSMGLDSECCLAIETEGDTGIAEAIT